jgi:hypothetical protein
MFTRLGRVGHAALGICRLRGLLVAPFSPGDAPLKDPAAVHFFDRLLPDSPANLRPSNSTSASKSKVPISLRMGAGNAAHDGAVAWRRESQAGRSRSACHIGLAWLVLTAI